MYNWSKISGDKYYAILDIVNSDKSEVEKDADIISLIEGIDAYSLPLNEFRDRVKRLSFINDFKLNKRPIKKIKLGGIEFKVNPLRELTFGNWVDYQQMIKMPFRDSYYRIISLFIEPNKEISIDEIHRLIREQMGWEEVQSLLYFFIKRWMSSLKNMETSTTDPRILEKMQELRTVLRSLIDWWW